MNEETEGIIGSHYCPKWSRACGVTAQDAEGTERHWTLLHFYKKASGRETCFGFYFSARHFLWVFVEQKCPVVLPLCQKDKEDTVRRSYDVLGHNKDFSVSPACSLLLNWIDSAYSEVSVWSYSVQTDEVCLSWGEHSHLWLHGCAGPFGTFTVDFHCAKNTFIAI